MTLEIDVQNAIRAELGSGPTRLFRQASSFYYTGQLATINGKRVLLFPKQVRVGFDGQPDLGGWTSVVVTPEMVGQTIAVAVQIEVKRPMKNKKGDEQKAFIAFCQSVGVRAGFARSVDEARSVISGDPLLGVDKR